MHALTPLPVPISATRPLNRSRLSVFMIGVFSMSLAATVAAQNVVSASPDITIDLGGNTIPTDEDVAVDNQLGVVVLENLGSIPGASDVTALGHDLNGVRLISFDTTTLLTGGVVARPGDVVRYDGVGYALEFDASAAGLPSNVATDAVSLSAVGLLLSFDTTVDLGGGLVVADEDLVDWDGASFALVFDGSAEGIDSALDIDAAQDIGLSGWVMSFDTSGTVAGLDFQDEDVLRFDGANWSLEFDASAANAAWAAADLDAVMVPEPTYGGLLGTGGALLLVLKRRRQRASARSLERAEATESVRSYTASAYPAIPAAGQWHRPKQCLLWKNEFEVTI